jgi:S1-C subfamily serine protease
MGMPMGGMSQGMPMGGMNYSTSGTPVMNVSGVKKHVPDANSGFSFLSGDGSNGKNDNSFSFVGDVMKGSKATEAGIVSGDVILSLEGEAIRNLDDLRNELLRKQVGDKVKLAIMRDGAKIEKLVELVRRGDAG